eukprot:TRINITY_DN3515_c0_g1_i2.p1 TRINITY_DN3515_c0_g1~~TRINITY_DN3515_c0_g1_i2.p1  ORF type:complete len:853 (-),score=225.26 TRINITY_DN3515_c0_g1_i2:38-2596(-)
MFKWYQNPNTVFVSFAVPAATKKTDVDVVINASSIKAGVKGYVPSVQGNLSQAVKPASSKWDVKNNSVLIQLDKEKKTKWNEIFARDERKKVKVLYDYDAQDTIELTIKEEEIIFVIKEDQSGWWKGELNGKVGLFPSNFIEELPNEPQTGGPSESPYEDSGEPASGSTPSSASSSSSTYPALNQSSNSQGAAEEEPTGEEIQPQPTVRVAMPGMVATSDGSDPMAELRNRLQQKRTTNIDEQLKQSKAPPTSNDSRTTSQAALKSSGGAPPPAKAPAKLPVPSPGAVPLKKSASPAPVPAKTSAESAPAKVAVAPKPQPGQAQTPQPIAMKKAASPAPGPAQTPAPAVAAKTDRSPSTSGAQQNKSPASSTESEPEMKIDRCKATFDYDAEADGELSFRIGDLIQIKLRDASGWWQGDLNGVTGWFPANFVEEMPAEEEEDNSQPVAAPTPVKQTEQPKQPPPPVAQPQPTQQPAQQGPRRPSNPPQPAAAPAPAPKPAVTPAKKVEPAPVQSQPQTAAKASKPPVKAASSGKGAPWPQSLPPFEQFCDTLVALFDRAANNTSGAVSSQFPFLSQSDPEAFGFAVCASDGSKFSHGYDGHFSFQACTWPFIFGFACEEFTEDKVFEAVGTEPSTSPAHAMILNAEKKPHNPMVNAGAMLVTKLLGEGLEPSAKISYVLDKLSDAAGCRVSCSMPTYISMNDNADRDLSLGYWLRSNGNISKETDLKKLLDYYFQICSIEGDCQTGATLAATIANEGVSPITNKKFFEPKTNKKIFSLTTTCGMNENSSQWADLVGISGKCSISGATLLVVPKVMGICIYAPRLDQKGISARAHEFCKLISENFSSLKSLRF